MYFSYVIEAEVKGETESVGTLQWGEKGIKQDIKDTEAGNLFLTLIGERIVQVNTPPPNFYPGIMNEPPVSEFNPNNQSHWGMLLWDLRNTVIRGYKFIITQLFEDDTEPPTPKDNGVRY